MPIKIHHGPPGAYKTSGAMGDDFLREARAGRVIVTNVRGVSRERVLAEFDDLPASFDVIHVGDKTPEDLQKWAKWFHWVPKGAFIFVDEAQLLFPKSWREQDLRALDYPGGMTKAAEDDRPPNWELAWDKHRHWNWDFVLTAPAYKKIRDDIKSIADMAYKHKNLALIGWTGRYIEANHLPDDDGGSPSHFLSVNTKKVPDYVFRLYDSTATGAFSDTKSGLSLFKNPRVLLLLGILAICFFVIFRNGSPKIFPASASAPASVASKPAPSPAAVPSSDSVASGGASGGSGGGRRSGSDFLKPFAADDDAYIVVSMKSAKGWRYVVRYKGQDWSSQQMFEAGFAVLPRGSCHAVLVTDHYHRPIMCEYRKDDYQEREAKSVPVEPVKKQAEVIEG